MDHMTPAPQTHDSHEGLPPVPAVMGQSQGSPFDPRVTALLNWLFGTLISGGLIVGAYYFAGMRTDMAELKKAQSDSTTKLHDEISDLRTELAKKDSDRRDIEELKKGLESLRDQFYKILEDRRK